MVGCGTYTTKEHHFILTTHQSVFGFGVADEPFFKAEIDADGEEIGCLILQSLAGSQTGVETTGRLKDLGKKMIDFVGYRTAKAFEKASIYINVSADGEQVTLTPSVTAGKSGGFLLKPDSSLHCSLAVQEVGQTFLKLLDERKRLLTDQANP